VQLEQLVTDRFPLTQTNEGFERQLVKSQAMKVMIQP
jgi:hypothetical protein